jgi:hypothetical protein
MSDLFGVAGTRLLEELRLPRAYGLRVASLRELLGRWCPMGVWLVADHGR